MKQQDSRQFISTLEQAGAGISVSKRLMAKHLMFPLLNRLVSWDKAWDIYEKEGRKVISLAATLDKESLFKRVLVSSLFGLEDNSRYYSVAMVIEHLLIVGKALTERIPPLSQGEVLKEDVKIEDVKPYTEIDKTVIEAFETFLDTYREEMEGRIGDIEIDNTSPHPWFGEFNPKEWSILGMVHQIVHRRQVEAIIRRLQY